MHWSLQSHFTRWLVPGATRAEMVLSISATGDYALGSEARRCVGFLLDISGSMEKAASADAGGKDISRMQATVDATLQAIETLPTGTSWFVITFNSRAFMLIEPKTFEGVVSGVDSRALQGLVGNEEGSTKFSYPLAMAYETFCRYPGYICQAFLLTDGKIDDIKEKRVLDEILEGRVHSECRLPANWASVFQVHCRGVGLEWHPQTLMRIADATMGDAGMVTSAEDMKTDFLEMMSDTRNLMHADVRLRLVVPPKSSRLVSIRQALPTEVELTGRITQASDGAVDVGLGFWGADSRDYMLVFEFSPLAVGQRLMVCRPCVIVDSKDETESRPMVVEWSTDGSLNTRMDNVVAHYRGQSEKTKAIDEGVRAMSVGDIVTATRRLGDATRMAAESGDHETLERIGRVVNVVDAANGTVIVPVASHSKAAVMELIVSSTRAVEARVLDALVEE